ncbi:CHC2 zinc finger domain-containing protein [Desulforhopalus singaporensis]|uniref:CHC2 zinc finger n=1 Tax=Desulforhopalus singaporensis TaxID=91360 RepID=A0A1H0NRF1_9BACT|nr:CHC2 zinc finger domain-containing protein [Desulforhopalus singaporensis]SDO95211.1 CHC2 zinc finger [Desulforhopalus singaporensis]
MNTSSIVEKIAADYRLRRRGKLYAGPCPFCGGSSKSDKFNIRPDGGYICRGCGKTGDIITWLREKDGMNCPDAHDRAGRQCRRSAACPASEKCRYGDKKLNSSRTGRNHVRRSRHYPHQQEDRTISEIIPEYPTRVWLSWAEEFVGKCHDRLLKNETELEYLAGRGIDRKSIERFSLGWVSHQYQIAKKDIGLAIEEDGKTNMWVPEGLLIPIYDNGGALHRIRIRRPVAAREKFLKTLKYVWLKGSGNLPMVIMPGESHRGAVVVEAELDAIAIAASHKEVMVIAVGTLHGGVSQELQEILEGTAVILVALDAESKSVDAAAAWKRTFRHAKYWPTPKAKDAGDFFQRGGDLAGWIESGLPPKRSAGSVDSGPASPPVSFSQDEAFSPARERNGGEGEKELYQPESEPECIEIVLSNGKVIYIVQQKNELWERMSAEGKAVFTRWELERLKKATATMDPKQRIKAAMAAIEAKEVFGGYLSRGENYDR